MNNIIEIINNEIDKFITLYHGTKYDNALNLIENGWQPNMGYQGANMGQSKYLYLTTEIENALWYADENGGNTVVEVKDIPIEYLKPDPEDEAGYTIQDLFDRIKTTNSPANFVLFNPLNKSHFKIIN